MYVYTHTNMLNKKTKRKKTEKKENNSVVINDLFIGFSVLIVTFNINV